MGISESADAPIKALFAVRIRWFTTVGLQGALSVLFVFFPAATMKLFGVPPSTELAILFQLYGTVLAFKTMVEQYVRSAEDAAWMRRFMVASFPFNMGLAYFLGMSAWRGLMNPWVGGIFAAMAVVELGEFIVVLRRWSRALDAAGGPSA